MYDLSLGKGFPCDQYSAIWNTSFPTTSIFQYLLDENSTWLTWRDPSFKVILSCCPIIIQNFLGVVDEALFVIVWNYPPIRQFQITGSLVPTASWKKVWRTLSKKQLSICDSPERECSTTRKLTRPLNRNYFSREYIFQPLIFRCYASFQGVYFVCLLIGVRHCFCWSKPVSWGKQSWKHILSRKMFAFKIFPQRGMVPFGTIHVFGWFQSTTYPLAKQHIPFQGTFEDDVPFSKVGFVRSLEGNS